MSLRLRWRVINLLDAIDDGLLDHRWRWFCNTVASSSWWTR